jgi:beta propeller domain-containing protein
MFLRALLAAVLAAALMAVPGSVEADAAPAPRAKLKAFDSCAGLVRYARRHAVRTARSQLLRGRDEQESGAGGGEGFSRTNVQEQGVDEPDIVKTDGAHVFAIAGGALQSVDVQAATPVVLDTLKLAENASHALLLHGDRLLVISSLYYRNKALDLPEWAQSTRLIEVDASDPARLRVVNTFDAEGGYLSARLTGPTARIVLRGTPRALDGTLAGVRRARLAKWVPRGVLTRRATGGKRTRRLVACRAVRRPAAFSGVDMMTVLTVDLERGLPAVDSDGLMTDADTVYASTGSLYVATQRWSDALVEDGEPPDGVRTAIHRFDASERGVTSYVSSGEVRGFLVSQWALSEHAGHLRVASTTVPPWWGDEADESESYVTVLRENGRRLDLVGRVGGLGRGEQIYAVRFIGDVGYVVTFRQVDPLYTVDLATPTAPKVLGELKIRGYSAYLHPVGEDLLLGVGQDATRQGRQLGTQLSLFDVSDLRAPRRLHQATLADGSSEVEYDHHAFLYWPASGLAVLPIQDWKGREPAFAAAAFRVDRAGIADLGRLAHPVKDEWRGQIRRSLVVGERVLTLSEAGVLASPLDTLSGGAWVRFPR